MDTPKIRAIRRGTLAPTTVISKRQVRRITQDLYHCDNISMRHEQLRRLFVCHHIKTTGSHIVPINMLRKIAHLPIFRVPLASEIRAKIIGVVYHNFYDPDLESMVSCCV